MKSVISALMLLVFSGATLAQSNYAPDYAEAFAPTAHVQVVELTAVEMDETEGDALIVGAVIGAAIGAGNAIYNGASPKRVAAAAALGAVSGLTGGLAGAAVKMATKMAWGSVSVGTGVASGAVGTPGTGGDW